MADLTTRLIWSRLKQGWANMAEVFDELICSFDTGESTMEITTVLLVGWVIFCVLLIAMGRWVNQRFLKPQKVDETTIKQQPAGIVASAAVKAATEALAASAAAVAPVAVAVKPKPAEVTVLVPQALPSPSAAGATGAAKKKSSPAAASSREAVSKPSAAAAPEFFSTKPVPTVSKPKPEPAPKLRDITVPFATGSDKDAVTWANSLLKWLYADPRPTPTLLKTWIDALNNVTKQLAAENGVQLVFQEITEDSMPLALTNVMADPGQEGDTNIYILCDAAATKLGFIVQVTRQMGENFWSTEYNCEAETFAGPVSVACDPDRLIASAHFDCRPKINLVLKPNPRTQSANAVDEQALQTVVNEIITNALTHASVDLPMSQMPGCPPFVRTVVIPDPIIPVHYDSMIPASTTQVTQKKMLKKGKRLLVKVMKADNLGSDKGCVVPYCVVELDEPSKKHFTATSEGKNPFWDEQFLFELNNETGELLFEVWDKQPKDAKGERFMGLGIVSVDELLRTPSQRQIVALQSRPYEGDDVTGSLTVEFLTMDGVELSKFDKDRPPRPPPPSPIKVVDQNRTISPHGTVVTTTTSIRKVPVGPPVIFVNGEDTVTSTALRELSKPHPPAPAEKSTLIIHSVQRTGFFSRPADGAEATKVSSDSAASLEDSDGERSRPKERKSFMNTLRKRFSFRGKRSRSVDQNQDSSSRESSASRSASVDRVRNLQGLPTDSTSDIACGENNLSPASRLDNASTRSSLSESSAISSGSTQTYIDEASMLVIETIENGIIKHYLIPATLAYKSKGKKRGTKLHIYNDHTFVAKHLASNTVCEVCQKAFIRRIGKQGYECRDCLLKCHKPCHVRTDKHCPSSTVGAMELEYVQETAVEPQVSKKTK